MKCFFETERLRARGFETADATRLFEIHKDEAVKRWLPEESYADIAEAREAIAFFADLAERRTLPFVLAVESKETGELIGDCGLNAVAGKPGQVEIGYVVCAEKRNIGCASELVRAMTEFALSVFDTSVIYGRVMHGNVASARVLEKNGYRFVKEEYGAEDDPYGRGMLVYMKTRTTDSPDGDGRNGI